MTPEPNVADNNDVLSKLLKSPREAGRWISSEGTDCPDEVEKEWWKKVSDRVAEDSRWFAGAILVGLVVLYMVLVVSGPPYRHAWAILVFVAVPITLLLWRCVAKQRILSRCDNQDELSNWLSQNRNWFWLKQWKVFCFVRPQSLEQTWLWVLFVGLVTAFAKDLAKPETDINAVAVESFGTIFLLALITFIATTVIDELYHSRGEFQETRKAMLNSAELSKTLRTELLSLKDVLREYASTTQMITTVKAWKHLFSILQKTGAKAVQELLNKLTKNLHDQVSNTSKHLNVADTLYVEKDKLILWLLTTFNAYFASQTNIPQPDGNTKSTDHRTSLITKFTTLGEIAADLVRQTCLNPDAPLRTKHDGLEFYTLLVLPPEKVLNFDDMQYCGDDQWEEFLKQNIEARKAGIKVCRHFLVIDGADMHDKETVIAQAANAVKGNKINSGEFLPREAVALDATDVKEHLRKFVAVEEKGSGFEPLLVPTGENDRMKYRIEKEKPADGHEYWTLAEVLARIYHSPECCQVLEVGVKDFNTYLRDCVPKHPTERISSKPFDYFAIRWNNRWVFCLQSRYDRDFDVAKIEVLHVGLEQSGSEDEKQQWKSAVEKLDKMFSPDPSKGRIGNRKTIEEYAKAA